MGMVFRYDWSEPNWQICPGLFGGYIGTYDVFPPLPPPKKRGKKKDYIVSWNMFLSNDGPIAYSQYSSMVVCMKLSIWVNQPTNKLPLPHLTRHPRVLFLESFMMMRLDSRRANLGCKGHGLLHSYDPKCDIQCELPTFLYMCANFFVRIIIHFHI